jgi:hypothetical protein
VTFAWHRSSVPRALAFVCVLGVGCAAVAGAGAATSKPAKVMFVGDSVPASVEYAPDARRVLRNGLRVTFDLRVCRRLVAESCSFQGSTPSTALEAVRGQGRSLGDVLVVDVGYNESASGYGRGIDRVMRAALAQGATGVVWVTLRETRATYHATNVAIRAAARRWPQLVVADWDAYSRGRPWFGSDGLHLTVSGASALAAFVRRHVLQIAA